MINSQTNRVRQKGRLCILWIAISAGVWFANCDKITRTTVLQQMLGGRLSEIVVEDEKEQNTGETTGNLAKTEAYLDDRLAEYCFSVEFAEQAEDSLTDTEQVQTEADLKTDAQIGDAEDTSEQATDTEQTSEELAVRQASIAAVTAMAGSASYASEKLADYDYLKSHYYVVDSTTSVSRGELDGEKLCAMDLTIDTQTTDYKILIYHTHGTEAFSDSRSGEVDDTVIGVGNYLTTLLEDTYGVSVYHDTTAYDMKDGTLDRSAAYDYARDGVQAVLKQYPSIEVVIDIHRDGVSEGTYFVTEINGKKTAQVMFLNGVSRLNKNGDISYLTNPYKQENLAFSLQLYLTAKANYADFVRKIYIKGYRYNLDLMPRALLVEVGSQTNTVQEAKNAMEPLAAILYKVLSGE